jgi:adenylylsulfate kinase
MLENHGQCYWVTGLSGAGKTSVCRQLLKSMKEINSNTILLDGDDLRKVLNTQAFNREERLEIAFTYARLAKLLTSQGTNVVFAVMALFSEVHKWNRENIKCYTEVFLDVPIEELIRRDTKGLYEKYNSGQLKNMAGLDQNADLPKNPEFYFKWDENLSIDLICSKILDHFRKNQLSV